MRLKKIQKSRFWIDEQLDKWINLLDHWPFYIFLRGVELYKIEQANQKRAPNSKTILGVRRLVIPRGLFPDNCHFIWNQHFFVFFKRLEYSSWRIKLDIFSNLETFLDYVLWQLQLFDWIAHQSNLIIKNGCPIQKQSLASVGWSYQEVCSPIIAILSGCWASSSFPNA